MTRAELLLELEASRRAISRDYDGVCHAANLPARAKSAFRRHPIPWLGGAAALGWLLSGRGRKQKKVMVERQIDADGNVVKEKAKKLGIFTILLTILRIAMPLLKPAFTALAAKKFADLAGKLK
jgi:hypothetical protein